MKKVLILLIAGFLLLPFTGCDTGTSPSNPVNPVQPAEPTLATGSLVLTIADPGVNPVDGNNPYAVITGATATGSTFREELPIPYGDSAFVTVNNLIPGTWNIKVKIWDDLYAGDDLEDVVALGYETVVVAADDVKVYEAVVNPDDVQESDFALYTQDGINTLLLAVYENDPWNISDEGVQRALTWGVYALMAYDEETFIALLENDDSEADELNTLLEMISELSADPSLYSEIVTFLNTVDELLENKSPVTYMNDELGLSLTADGYISLFSEMLNTVKTDVVGDFNPLYYDLIDLTVSGLAQGDILSDTDSLSVSVSSDYAAQGTYTWVLNGSVVGTGSSYTLSGADCVEGLNLLSVQYSYEGLVILGSENVVFYRETTVQRLLISDIDFNSDIVKDAALATGLAYADDVKIMGIVADENSLDYEGIQYLVNLQSLIIINGGDFSGSDFSAMAGLSNLTTIYFRYDWPFDAVQNEIQSITPNTVTFVPQLISQ